MKGATHFIEQYRWADGINQFSPIFPINSLQHSINVTKILNGKTVAIFLIKPKTPTNEQ